MKPILMTAICTGMRSGEILSLKWDQIDFNIGLITVDQTKSGEIRKIPMNEELTKTLQEIKLQPDSSPAFVFCKTDGRPYGHQGKIGGFTQSRKQLNINNVGL